MPRLVCFLVLNKYLDYAILSALFHVKNVHCLFVIYLSDLFIFRPLYQSYHAVDILCLRCHSSVKISEKVVAFPCWYGNCKKLCGYSIHNRKIQPCFQVCIICFFDFVPTSCSPAVVCDGEEGSKMRNHNGTMKQNKKSPKPEFSV